MLLIKGNLKIFMRLLKTKLKVWWKISKNVASVMNLSWKYILNMPSHLWDTGWLSMNLPIQLEKWDHFHNSPIKGLLDHPSKGPTPAVIHSPDGLGIPSVCDTYLESHILAYAQCMVKADNRVVHALKCKVDRESEWRRKKINMARAVGTKNIKTWLTRMAALGLIGQNLNKWSKIS